MKPFGWALVLLLAAACPLCAQVSVEVRLVQTEYLPGESLTVAVRITNRSGQTLRLGADEDWLTFSVESPEGFVVEKLGDAPVAGEFDLKNSRTATKHVDIAPYFTLDRQGRFTVIATVRIKEWNHQVASLPKSFTIIEGAKLWEQTIGVPPKSGDTNAAPDLRKYILQQANYVKGQLRLYLRVTDVEGAKTFRVQPVGRLVSISRPEHQVDKLSNLHVLFANGPTSYSYNVFDPDGELIAREVHDYVGTRPRLQPDKDGAVKVVGGVRRVTTTDLPQLKTEMLNNPAETSQPR